MRPLDRVCRCRSSSHASPHERTAHPIEEDANALRGQLHEFGIVAAQGRIGLGDLVTLVIDLENQCIPDLATETVTLLSHSSRKSLVGSERPRPGLSSGIGQMKSAVDFKPSLRRADHSIGRCCHGHGPGAFHNGRQFAAWLGLVPGRIQLVARSASAVLPNGVMLTSETSWLCFSTQPGPHPKCRGKDWNCAQNRWLDGVPIGADQDPTLGPISVAASK